MKNNKSLLLIYILLLSIIVTSCTSLSNNAPISIDNKYVNKQILIRAPLYANTFNTNDPVVLELKYNSNNEITFPNDYNFAIFEITDNGWAKINEYPTKRIPSGDVVFTPEKYIPAATVIYLWPELSSFNKKHSLRIYVIGKMNDNGDLKDVVAYTDIVLYP